MQTSSVFPVWFSFASADAGLANWVVYFQFYLKIDVYCTFCVSGQWTFAFALWFWWISRKDFSLSASDGFLERPLTPDLLPHSIGKSSDHAQCSLHFAWESHTQWWPWNDLSHFHFVILKQLNSRSLNTLLFSKICFGSKLLNLSLMEHDWWQNFHIFRGQFR